LEHYEAPQKDRWTGRIDNENKERFFQHIECIDLKNQNLAKANKNAYAIAGFACDLGVKNNQGREGAKEGPNAIRKQFANLSTYPTNPSLIDVGNIIEENHHLEKTQTALGNVVAELITKQYTPIILGGGHEIAWGHYQGIAKANKNKNLGIINIDAHFDLRPLENNEGSSGTPFLQVANHCKEHGNPFKYLCIGIQNQSNTESLWETANNLNVKAISADDLWDQEHSKFHLNEFIESVD